MQYRNYDSKTAALFIVLSIVFLFAGSVFGAPDEAVPTTQPIEESNPTTEPLRDPFWKVGYFPTGWGTEPGVVEEKLTTEEWDAPAALLKVNGVSRMGKRVMALVNGKLYSTGDFVEIVHLGKTFQWRIAKIKPDGTIQFERHKIVTDTPR